MSRKRCGAEWSTRQPVGVGCHRHGWEALRAVAAAPADAARACRARRGIRQTGAVRTRRLRRERGRPQGGAGKECCRQCIALLAAALPRWVWVAGCASIPRGHWLLWAVVWAECGAHGTTAFRGGGVQGLGEAVMGRPASRAVCLPGRAAVDVQFCTSHFELPFWWRFHFCEACTVMARRDGAVAIACMREKPYKLNRPPCLR
eukprot:351486-Chlamydomonas_euryale.AAC.8